MEPSEADRPWHYDVETTGWRYRLGNLNAAIGLAQLERFDEFRTRKRRIVDAYDRALADATWLILPERRLEETFPFLYPIRVLDGKRDGLLRHLATHGVQGWVHFIPNHLQPAFVQYATPLPTTVQLYSEIATLPLHAGMTEADEALVLEALAAFDPGEHA